MRHNASLFATKHIGDNIEIHYHSKSRFGNLWYIIQILLTIRCFQDGLDWFFMVEKVYCVNWRGDRVGRRCSPAKRVSRYKRDPGFKSLPLRHTTLLRSFEWQAIVLFMELRMAGHVGYWRKRTNCSNKSFEIFETNYVVCIRFEERVRWKTIHWINKWSETQDISAQLRECWFN